MEKLGTCFSKMQIKTSSSGDGQLPHHGECFLRLRQHLGEEVRVLGLNCFVKLIVWMVHSFCNLKVYLRARLVKVDVARDSHVFLVYIVTK